MAQTRDIQRRLRSVKNTKKITKAMELVASAKVRKASQAVLATRPYTNEAWSMLLHLAGSTNAEAHPLLRRHASPKKIGIVLVASSRGLVGGFNTNLINATATKLRMLNNAKAEIILMGSKGRSIMFQHGHTIMAEFTKEDIVTNVASIRPMAKLAIENFRKGEFDQVLVAYVDYVSTLVQKPVVRQLLPLTPEQAKAEMESKIPSTEYLFEPDPDSVLEYLLPRLVEMQIYRAVLETNASEQAARMLAMRNATDAAGELIDDLTLTFNQARQASITQDLAEISAGRAALE